MGKRKNDDVTPAVLADRHFSRRVQVTLTVEEITARGRALAEAEANRSKVDAERKAAASTFRDTIVGIDAVIDRLTREVNSGEEERAVACVEAADHERGEWVTTRTDTGEVLDTRPFSAEERQGALFD